MYSVASTEGYFLAGDALYSPISVIPTTSYKLDFQKH